MDVCIIAGLVACQFSQQSYEEKKDCYLLEALYKLKIKTSMYCLK